MDAIEAVTNLLVYICQHFQVKPETVVRLITSKNGVFVQLTKGDSSFFATEDPEFVGLVDAYNYFMWGKKYKEKRK